MFFTCVKKTLPLPCSLGIEMKWKEKNQRQVCCIKSLEIQKAGGVAGGKLSQLLQICGRCAKPGIPLVEWSLENREGKPSSGVSRESELKRLFFSSGHFRSSFFYSPGPTLWDKRNSLRAVREDSVSKAQSMFVILKPDQAPSSELCVKCASTCFILFVCKFSKHSQQSSKFDE